LKQKDKFCLPQTSLFLSLEDFHDAFCVATDAFGGPCGISAWQVTAAVTGKAWWTLFRFVRRTNCRAQD